MRLTLSVQADAPDFDLWTQILMVRPDGSTVNLGEDIRRARFRNSVFKAELLKPDEVVQIPFQFSWTARRIPAGARLRLTIAPLNSPNYQKNYNTGGRMGYERIEDARIANIKIFHDVQRRSYLTLPIAAPAQQCLITDSAGLGATVIKIGPCSSFGIRGSLATYHYTHRRVSEK